MRYCLRGTCLTTECDPETYHQDAIHSCPKTTVVDFQHAITRCVHYSSQVVPLWCRDIATETVTSSCTDHSASPIAEVACFPSCYSQLWSVALPPAPFKLGLTSKVAPWLGSGALKVKGMCVTAVLGVGLSDKAYTPIQSLFPPSQHRVTLEGFWWTPWWDR